MVEMLDEKEMKLDTLLEVILQVIPVLGLSADQQVNNLFHKKIPP